MAGWRDIYNGRICTAGKRSKVLNQEIRWQLATLVLSPGFDPGYEC